MEQSPLQPTPVGAIRFNTDYAQLEYYDGNQWVNVTSKPSIGVPRALFGYNGTINYVNIPTIGNAIDFGDLTTSNTWMTETCSSRTRGIFAGGFVGPAIVNTIDYVTILTTGNAADFGDLNEKRAASGGTSNNTRGIFGGGNPTPSPGTQKTDSIDYITIPSTGNAADFGNLSGQRTGISEFASTTRAIFAGGYTPTNTNLLEYINFSTTGNAVDFGDMYQVCYETSAASSPTRGVIWGGWTGSPLAGTNAIQYLTLATTGTTSDFGDTSAASASGCVGNSSSATRCVMGCVATAGSNVIEYITISTLGNAKDFGDLAISMDTAGALSNAHGGLA